MDLVKDLVEIIENEMVKLRDITKIDDLEIDYDNERSLLKQYLTIMYKLIFPWKPRNVVYSDELNEKIKNNIIPEEYENILKTIESKFEKGDDINPYLSRKALDPKEQDGLLFDWRIHHLHLSNEKNEEYFYDRSGYQLLFYLDYDTVYFIDARNHPKGAEWALEDFLQILDNNWPKLTKDFVIEGVDKAEHLTKEERHKFRKKGAFTFTEVNGKVFMPIGGGIPTDKSSIATTMESKRIISILKSFEEHETGIIEELDKYLKNNGKEIPETYNFKLNLHNNNLMVLEEESSLYFPLGIYWVDLNS